MVDLKIILFFFLFVIIKSFIDLELKYECVYGIFLSMVMFVCVYFFLFVFLIVLGS